MTTTETNNKTSGVMDWIIRLLKGVMVGIGFITPGLSGGVLAVVFGIYERLMRFLGNLRDKFVQNVLFFLPVGIGGVIGVVAFSAWWILPSRTMPGNSPCCSLASSWVLSRRCSRQPARKAANGGTGCCWF